jgi:hypothetical protein
MRVKTLFCAAAFAVAFAIPASLAAAPIGHQPLGLGAYALGDPGGGYLDMQTHVRYLAPMSVALTVADGGPKIGFDRTLFYKTSYASAVHLTFADHHYGAGDWIGLFNPPPSGSLRTPAS